MPVTVSHREYAALTFGEHQREIATLKLLLARLWSVHRANVENSLDALDVTARDAALIADVASEVRR